MLRNRNTSPSNPSQSKSSSLTKPFNTSLITAYYNNITTYDMWTQMSPIKKPFNIQHFLIENNSSIKNMSITTNYIDTNTTLDNLINIVGVNILIYKIKSIFYKSQKQFNGSINFGGFNSDSNNNINDIYYCWNIMSKSIFDSNQTWELKI